MNREPQNELVSRLDGALFAAGCLNGDVREFEYSAYLIVSSEDTIRVDKEINRYFATQFEFKFVHCERRGKGASDLEQLLAKNLFDRPKILDAKAATLRGSFLAFRIMDIIQDILGDIYTETEFFVLKSGDEGGRHSEVFYALVKKGTVLVMQFSKTRR